MTGVSFGNPERENPGLMEFWCFFQFCSIELLGNGCGFEWGGARVVG